MLTVDTFGNVQLAASADALRAGGLVPGAAVTVRRTANAVHSGRVWTARIGTTFGDVDRGGLVVLVDSAGRVAVAVNGGSAAATLGVHPGDELCCSYIVRRTVPA